MHCTDNQSGFCSHRWQRGASQEDKSTSKNTRKRSPAKGEIREPAVEKRLDRQVYLSAMEAIRELPTNCAPGTNKNAKGYKKSWNGYKPHLDMNDTGLPISALVTSSPVYDSQIAIPVDQGDQ